MTIKSISKESHLVFSQDTSIKEMTDAIKNAGAQEINRLLPSGSEVEVSVSGAKATVRCFEDRVYISKLPPDERRVQ